MDMTLIGYIALGAFFVLALVVTWLVATRNESAQKALDFVTTYKEVALSAISAAEQIYGIDSSTGEQKLEYALEMFTETFPGVNENIARMFIEEAVRLYKNALTIEVEE